MGLDGPEARPSKATAIKRMEKAVADLRQRTIMARKLLLGALEHDKRS